MRSLIIFGNQLRALNFLIQLQGYRKLKIIVYFIIIYFFYKLISSFNLLGKNKASQENNENYKNLDIKDAEFEELDEKND